MPWNELLQKTGMVLGLLIWDWLIRGLLSSVCTEIQVQKKMGLVQGYLQQ